MQEICIDLMNSLNLFQLGIFVICIKSSGSRSCGLMQGLRRPISNCRDRMLGEAAQVRDRDEMGKKRPFGPGPRVKRLHLTLLDELKRTSDPFEQLRGIRLPAACHERCLHLHIRRAIKSTSINIKHRLPSNLLPVVPL